MKNEVGARTLSSLLKLSADELVSTVKEVESDWIRYKNNALAMSSAMQQESGVQGIVAFVQKLLASKES